MSRGLLLESLKEITLAAILGATAFGIAVIQEIGRDVTAIKVMLATDSNRLTNIERRTDRLEARIYRE